MMETTMTRVTQNSHKGDGHRKRLRERFSKGGLDGFLDYEVIELLLTLNTQRQDCKDRAKELLERFKSRQGVFEANPEELARVKTQWVASEVYRLDSLFNQARALGSNWAQGFPLDAGQRLVALLRQVSAESRNTGRDTAPVTT